MNPNWNRRRFLKSSAAGLAGSTVLGNKAIAAETGSRVPFQVLYSNDTTHILSCQRPDERGEFTEELLRRSIVEASAADAHLLQPGLGWIPWWPSQIYSVEDHTRWLRDEFGIKGVRKVERYMLDGGDMLETLVKTCREINVAPFLSFRLNDGHHVRELPKALERGRPTQNMARHYWENYERFRIGADTGEWDDGVFDWSIPEVRDYKFALIEEACANYDLAGLELDFLRHWKRFGDRTSLVEREKITTAFVKKIRVMLDRTARERGLPRRWLSIRVPARAEVRPDQGIDLASLVEAGVDMINLSYSYFTWQDDSVANARAEVGDRAAIYPEMTHTTLTGRATAGSGTQPFQRTTDEQFYTTAKLAVNQGARGVSLFNFPYYRYHVTDTIGPFHEPPFHILPKLKHPDFLNRQPNWYFLSAGRNDPVLGERSLSAILNRDEPQEFSLLTLPSTNRDKRGLLRLRSDERIDDRVIEVTLNGTPIKPVDPVRVPLPHPYEDTWIGGEEELACYEVPSSMALESVTPIRITVKKGIRVRLIYLDLVCPC